LISSDGALTLTLRGVFLQSLFKLDPRAFHQVYESVVKRQTLKNEW